MTRRAPRPLRLLLACWLAVVAALCVGVPAMAADYQFPKFTGDVVDTANALPPDREAALTARLEAFQQKTGRQLVVVTLPYDENRDIDDYGYRLGRTWGVGLRDTNNGAVLMMVPFGPVGHRDVRIEVGTGLEPVLTDALSSVIVNTVIIPTFKSGDIPGGIDAGADAIMRQLSLSDPEAKAKQDAAIAAWNKDHARRQSGDGGGIGVIIWLAIMGLVFLSMIRGRRRHGPWGATRYGGSNWPIVLWGIGQALSNSGRGRDDDWGGGGWGGGGGGSGGGGGWTGGGFTGGGGGSFGGGGASGSW